METMAKVESWLNRYLVAEKPDEVKAVMDDLKILRLKPDELQVLLEIFKGDTFGSFDEEVYSHLSARRPLRPFDNWQSWEDFYRDEVCFYTLAKYWSAVCTKHRKRQEKERVERAKRDKKK
jgi:hypothetical protein